MVLEEDNETRNRLSLGCVIPTNSRAVPSQITERNRKDKLYNSIVAYLDKRELFWMSDEIHLYGNNLVKLLCDVLWYIDGHHSTLTSRGFQIPNSFAGFNVPELYNVM